MTLNRARQHSHRSGRRLISWSAILALLFAVLFVGVGAPVPLAVADDGDGDVTIAIDESTAVVTDDSGYSITLTVTNATDETLEAGTLTLATNTSHVFMSRTDIQDWAQGDSSIPATDTLGSADVPELDTGETTEITIDVNADNDVLQSITTWGPKPLLVTLRSDGRNVARTYTFLTRTQDGLQAEQTPAMNITVVLPLTGEEREVDEDALDALLAGDDVDSVTTLSGSTQTAQSQAALINAHPDLQTVADPTYLESTDTPLSADAVMQPAEFDITAYAALADAEAYESAGVGTSDWDAAAAAAVAQSTQTQTATADGDDDGDDESDDASADGNDSGDGEDADDGDATDGDATAADITAIAWQGAASWTLQALTTARQQGYEVVIADTDFDDDSTGTVHTGKYEIDTDAGTVTVLAAQRVLSELAQGQATSGTAIGEQTEGGRLARFVAQSAFYQMEQPYTSRNLLVCLDADADTHTVDALMRLIEQSSWLQLTDLQTLIAADAYLTGDAARQIVPGDANLDDDAVDSLRQTLDTLASDTADITRLTTSILSDDDTDADDDQNDNDEDDENDENGQNDAEDAWIEAVGAAGREFAMHALGDNADETTRMLEGSSTLSTSLLHAVSIMPLETMTVVSETASMPATIRNDLPYPVTVDVSSITDSSQIVTSREATVTVPANSEAQVTFTIRVVASGTTTAHLTLQDRDGDAFGDEQSTSITSSLQISDMSGFAIIVGAVALGLVGLWRQFHRKKDPDE